MLSSRGIVDFVRAGLIAVQPAFDEAQLRPCGLRVHLSSKYLVPLCGQTIDLRKEQSECLKFEERFIGEDGIVLDPGAFVLGSTIECFKLQDGIVGRLDGRSSLARIGLAIHCTSSTIDCNETDLRSIVLEIFNHGPHTLILGAGQSIGMVSFETLSPPNSSGVIVDQYDGQVDAVRPSLRSTPAYRG